MARLVGGLVALALSYLLWSLPEPPIVRLAALDAYRALGVELEDGRTLGDAVLDGPAFEASAEGEGTVYLGGVLIAPDPDALEAGRIESGDLDAHALARASIVRGLREIAFARGVSLFVDGEREAGPSTDDRPAHFYAFVDTDSIRLAYNHARGGELEVVLEDWSPPRQTSLIPPVIAIFLAILLRRPVIALFFGAWAATYLLRFDAGTHWATSIGAGLPDIATRLFWPKFWNLENGMIVGFVIFMLAMVGVMTRSGGIRGLMDIVARRAGGTRSTQFSAYLMGLAVFFDDYANTILVGTTMRPLTDRFKISREKLAYIVDSTAAPVAGLAVLSTWIAFEVSTFSAQLPAAGMNASEGYGVFLQTLPYRFYCILTLIAVPMYALGGRDFGPMLAAERRARSTGQVVRPGGKPMVGDIATRLEPAEGVQPAALRAVLPLALFVFVILFEILRVGGAFGMSFGTLFSLEGLSQVLYDGSGARPILIGSVAGFLLAVAFALRAGLRGEIFHAAWTTVRAMSVALLILYLAWMIGLACEHLGTASYLRAQLGNWLAPGYLPAILFLLAAAVAFSTGSSWSTMGILLPLVVGLAYDIGERGEIGGMALMLLSIGAVLEGAIFGDHCSPISDTTVLSSTAAASDHIDHVRTQAPYSILTMLVALGICYVPCALLGWNPLLLIAVASVLMFFLIRGLGKNPEDSAPPSTSAHA